MLLCGNQLSPALVRFGIGSPECCCLPSHSRVSARVVSLWTPGDGSHPACLRFGKSRGPGTGGSLFRQHLNTFIYAPTQISTLSCRLLPRWAGTPGTLPSARLSSQTLHTLKWFHMHCLKKKACKYEHLNENCCCKGDGLTWFSHLQCCGHRVCSQTSEGSVTARLTDRCSCHLSDTDFLLIPRSSLVYTFNHCKKFSMF